MTPSGASSPPSAEATTSPSAEASTSPSAGGSIPPPATSSAPSPESAGLLPSRPEIIAVVGATGTGKSDLSLAIAEHLAAHGRAAEVVNADAMQLYRGMDIGTAKLAPEDRGGVPHHQLDVLEPRDEASVAAYQRHARADIDAVRARGAVPLLVGGSGLYVSAVLFDFRFPERDPAVRQRLEAELEAVGPRALYDRLKALDPASATAIGQFNGRRIVRALEVVELTGEPLSGTLPEQPVPWRPAAVLRLGVPRDELVPRLDERVLRMWRAGLVDEVAHLASAAGLRDAGTAAKAIGYAQALAQLDGGMTEAEAVAEAQALTRRYARRQVGWFKRYAGAIDIDPLSAARAGADPLSADAVRAALRATLD